MHLPVSYICCLMPDGVKTYEVLLRRLFRGTPSQWLDAVVGFIVALLGGFGLFLLVQTEHVVDRKVVCIDMLMFWL